MLGPLEVRVGARPVEVPGGRTRLVLAALLAEPNRVVGVDELTEIVWEDAAPPTARRQVQNTVSQLRGLLLRYGAADRLHSTPAGYRLSVGPDDLDLLRHEALRVEARRLAAAGDRRAAAGALGEAVALWRGPAFGGLPGDRFRRLAATLEELRWSTVESHAEAALAEGGDGLVARLSGLVAEHPLRERLAAAYLLALYHSGRQADALVHYQRVAASLRDELGVDPGPELQRRFEAILRRDPALDPPAPRPRIPAPGGPAAGPSEASPADAVSAAPRRRSRGVRALAAAAAVLMLTGLAGDLAAPPPEMTGLFNVVAAPFTTAGPQAVQPVADRLHRALVERLQGWVGEQPGVRLRSVADPGDPAELARRHGADLVLTGAVRGAGDRATVTLGLFVTERTLGEAPEFVGAHEFAVTEPIDVLQRNWQLGHRLTEGMLRYLGGVTDLTRALGEYGLDDLPAAERLLGTAQEHFAAAGRAVGGAASGREVLHLLLGNVIGRADPARLGQAEEQFRAALAIAPGYLRARLGLAEAVRAAVPCRAGTSDPARLDVAREGYRSALAAVADPPGGPLLEMKIRLGLGLTEQCLSLAGFPARWPAAEAEFTRVERLRPSAPGDQRHALRLAAEAAAGRALTAMVTAGSTDGARYGGLPAAAAGYRRALDLLAQVGDTRPRTAARTVVFLCNLRLVTRQLGDPDAIAEVDRRLRADASAPSCPAG
ncbi:AfsR/SARP family transcriptional regulator [Actinoplanes sichuanensis]|uniref:AfsR/SARP family transcriptional regulator n=1 Tax=Actinoplanes sichuanensis TaxID=512349 RepID=A0ABW4A0D1_9ACTN|nr:AfsR/SARP family transcriptional regulator [Actinoplanes sichuanensis]